MSRFDLKRPMSQQEKDAKLLYLKSKCRIEDSGCWMWTQFKNQLGYGTASAQSQSWMAHRLVWVLTHGRIPEDKFVCHRCDQPPCINPDHLFIGDHTENQRDMIAKGRHSKGRQTHCKRGHPLSGDNVRQYDPGHRACLICQRAIQRIKKGWPKDLAYSAPPTPHGYRIVERYRSSAGETR